MSAIPRPKSNPFRSTFRPVRIDLSRPCKPDAYPNLSEHQDECAELARRMGAKRVFVYKHPNEKRCSIYLVDETGDAHRLIGVPPRMDKSLGWQNAARHVTGLLHMARILGLEGGKPTLK